MSALSESLESKALSLPLEDRARLAAHLLESVEMRPPVDPEQVERAWIEEANRRYQAYLRGEERVIPAEEVFSTLRADDR